MKQNIKLCNANQVVMVENCKKKITLHVQHTFCTFLCCCFPRQQRETSRNFLVTHYFYGGNVVCAPVHFFLLLLIFALMASGISHFLTAAIKFSCYSSNEIGLLCFFISYFSAFYVIHANVDLKIKSKERISFVVVFYL